MKSRFIVISALVLLFAAPTFSQTWLTDYDTAMAKAVEEDKHVLLFFTGSDWCPPCKRIKKDIYNSEKFIQFADDKLILLMADFPKRSANKLSAEQESKNKKLAARFGPKGFPTSIILNSEGKEKKRWVGYNPGSPEDYVEKFTAATEL